MIAEALNFIALPLVFAVIQAVLFACILGRAGFTRVTSLLSFVPVVFQIGIYFTGGWLSLYTFLAPVPLGVPLYQLAMLLISFVPLFILAFARWPNTVGAEGA